MGKTRIKEEDVKLNLQIRPTPAVNTIVDLPDITSFLLPKSFELLPNTTEIFELEFAFYEYNFLNKEEIIQRGAFFKSVDGIPTHHYLICSNNNSLLWEGRSEITKSYFKEGNFSTGYATHGLFPYRGKFHPQLIKGILNILKIQPGEVVLDPMCGSGTLNVEASIIGINSIGIEKSPFCVLMSKVKYETLKIKKDVISSILRDTNKSYKTLIGSNILPNEFSYCESFNTEKAITLLAFLDAMGYSRRCSKSIDILFPSVLNRYAGQISSFIQVRDKLNLKIGNARFDLGDARNLPLGDSSIDAVITSPPYSFAIDYAENDRPQLEYLGYNVDELRNGMIGLKGKTKKEKLLMYFEDMGRVLSEMYRVLKPDRYAVIIIGSNDIQTGGIRLETKIEEMATDIGFSLDQKIVKPIKGIQNTMKDEYILFLRKE
ncbi:MAG TPA: DNA methyltransferase [bacterium]|nr:DNA methyltransferase [bacterium]HPP29333.1 DNA methyltransferase [bacterium]